MFSVSLNQECRFFPQKINLSGIIINLEKIYREVQMKNIFRKILIKFLRAVLPIEISELRKKEDEIGGLLNETAYYVYLALAFFVASIISYMISLTLSGTSQAFYKNGLMGGAMLFAVTSIIHIIVYNNNYKKIKAKKKW